MLNALAGERVGAVERFQFIPFLALEVDAAALRALAAHAPVRSVREETDYRPALAESTPLIGATSS